MFDEILNAHHRMAAPTAPARETLSRMLQSVAEVCVDEGKSGVPAPW
jgi:hypothetical protein